MKTSNTSNKTNKIRTAKENKTNNSKRVRLFDIAIVNGIDKCIAIEKIYCVAYNDLIHNRTCHTSIYYTLTAPLAIIKKKQKKMPE